MTVPFNDQAGGDVPHIIVSGNPIDGFEHIGPFPTYEAAQDHADSDGNLEDDDWWIVKLQTP